MRPNRDRHLDYLIVVILATLCYILFLHQLGGIGFLGPDEPRYADVAREMFVSGDYVTPRLAGENWFEKPALMYWLAAIGYAIFGIGETGARLPSALGATLSVFLIYWCGRRVFDRAVGFTAAAIMATSVGFFALARAASMDMLLTTSLTAALAFFLVALSDGTESRRWFFYAFYAAIGLGVLAKGPVAVVLPVLSLGLFTLWRGTRHDWKRWHPEGLAITAVVAGPWYAIVTWVNGREFFDVFFLNHNLQRFTSEVHGHPQPFYFYLPALLLLFFPWSFVLIPALRQRYTRGEQLTLLWAAVPIVFFSLAGSKLPAYILSAVPPLALLCAREILRREVTRGFRIGVFLQAALWVAIGVTLGFFGDSLNVDLQLEGMLALVPAFALAGNSGGGCIVVPADRVGSIQRCVDIGSGSGDHTGGLPQDSEHGKHEAVGGGVEPNHRRRPGTHPLQAGSLDGIRDSVLPQRGIAGGHVPGRAGGTHRFGFAHARYHSKSFPGRTGCK